MWFTISLLGIVTFLFWYFSAPFYWRKRNVPYLKPFPIFGNFFSMFTKGLIDFNASLYTNFPGKPFYGLHFYTRPALFVKDPELIQKILITDFEYFTSHGMYSNQDRDPAGGNLFHIYGQEWKEMRGKLSQYFTPGKVKAMLTYVDKSLQKAMEHIDNNIAANEPVEMKYVLMNITTDVITQAIFGVETDTFKNKDSIFSEVAEQMFKVKLTSRTFVSIISPKLYDLLKLCVLDDKSNATVVDIVRQTVEYRRKENVQMQDYLQGMMELMDNYTDSGQKYFPDRTRVPREYNYKFL
uniref:Cytochrome n=1 Tax=Rhodnius prolixus TaxID=13249 RepID=T1HBE8_RHOPR